MSDDQSATSPAGQGQEGSPGSRVQLLASAHAYTGWRAKLAFRVKGIRQ